MVRVFALGASCALAGAGLLLAGAMLGAQTRSPLAPLPEPSAPLTPMMPPSTSLNGVRVANPVVTTGDETVLPLFSFGATKSARRARFAEASAELSHPITSTALTWPDPVRADPSGRTGRAR
ncbi:MAG TPA: hypothetical protein VFG87_02455 [Amycolatopsis sp.]|nr:hypothetical protein [Amycolatopsis sp.]